MVIDKRGQKTEADCILCRENTDEPVLSDLIGRTNEKIVLDINQQLEKVSQRSQSIFNNKTPSKLKTPIEKICHPNKSLNVIINRNFRKTCSRFYKDFKSFAQKVHCDACEKGIPPEVMMAIMSVETDGRCNAESEVKNEEEHSVGLFQINATVTPCHDHKTNITHEKNTPANVRCFKDANNNLSKAIEKLADHYNAVNPYPINKSKCPSWQGMTPKERDTWRRGVAAYNSGPGWITRAIHSVRDRRTSTNTRYLYGQHAKQKSRKKYREDPASWEHTRIYSFVEKLSPGNKKEHQADLDNKKTGRPLNRTVGNIAYTEAALGREVEGSQRGLVEIWTQYLKDKKPKSCPIP